MIHCTWTFSDIKEGRRQTWKTEMWRTVVQTKAQPFWRKGVMRKGQGKIRGEIRQCLCGTYLGMHIAYVVCLGKYHLVEKATLFQERKGMVASLASDPVPCFVCGRHLQYCLLLQQWWRCFWLTYSLLPSCSWILWKEAPFEEQGIFSTELRNLNRLLQNHKNESHISLCVLYGYFPNLQHCLQSDETFPSNNLFKR